MNNKSEQEFLKREDKNDKVIKQKKSCAKKQQYLERNMQYK